MQLKTSLHIHTSEDKKDGHMINYDVYKLIDTAVERGFRVLGYTPHNKFVFKEEYASYARNKGVLLIPGVERGLGMLFKKHVLILNCDESAEKIKKLKHLEKYKKDHPEALIIAPHPTYNRAISLGARNLKKHIETFDAIEHSCVYTKKLNSNKKAKRIAKEFHKPVIATGDVHRLKKLDTDFALIEAEEFSIEAVFDAIKRGNFQNITEPKKLREVVGHIATHIYRYCSRFITVKILRVDNRYCHQG